MITPQIYSHKFLTKKEEYSCIKKYQKNKCQESLDKLILSNISFIINQAKYTKNYCNRNIPLDDYCSEGVIGLIEAIPKFDCSLGYRLLTYATHYIERNIKLLAMSSDVIKIPRSQWKKGLNVYEKFGTYVSNLDQYCGLHYYDKNLTYEPPKRDEDTGHINSILNELYEYNPRISRIIHGYFYKGKTLQSLGNELGISKQRVQQIKNVGLRFIKEKMLAEDF